jgi:membrane protein
LPPQLADVVRNDLGSMLDATGGGTVTMGVLLAIFFASGGTLGVMRATNRAYDVPEARPAWQRYAVAVGLTVLAGVGAIVAFVLLIVTQLFSQTIVKSVGGGDAARVSLIVLRWLLAFLALLGSSAVLYRIAPSLTLRWRTVVPGAVLFSVGWLVATAGFAIYVSTVADYGSAFGALGGALVLLTWLYLTAVVLLVGAECNAVLAEVRNPAEIDEARQAVRREHDRREQQTRRELGFGPEDKADKDADAATT